MMIRILVGVAIVAMSLFWLTVLSLTLHAAPPEVGVNGWMLDVTGGDKATLHGEPVSMTFPAFEATRPTWQIDTMSPVRATGGPWSTQRACQRAAREALRLGWNTATCR